MSQIFGEKGNRIPVTLIEAGPCIVTQIKNKEKPRTRTEGSTRDGDGYEAVQIGFKELKQKKIKKSQKNKPFRYLKEYKMQNTRYRIQEINLGDKIDVGIFQEGDIVKVSGISKGKGFQGVVKKWGFSGRGASHGVKHEARTPGSVGSSFPEHVAKGRKMPGRMGNERVTVKNLKIVKIDPQNNIIAVKGAVPGRKGTLLEIRSAI